MLGLELDICAFFSLVLSFIIYLHTLEVDKNNTIRLLEEKKIEVKRLMVDIALNKKLYDIYRQKQMNYDYKNDDERNLINEKCSEYESNVKLQYNLLLQYVRAIVGHADKSLNLGQIEDISDRFKKIENLINNEIQSSH